MLKRMLAALLLAGAPVLVAAQGFDHSHAAWETLLGKHVRAISNGNASQVDYKGFAQDHNALQAYLKSLSSERGGVRRLEQGAEVRFSRQCLQRLYDRKDPHALSQPQVDPRLRQLHRQSVEGQVFHHA